MRLYLDLATSRFSPDPQTDEEPQVLRVAWWRDDHDQPICRLIDPPVGTTIDPETFPYHGITDILDVLGDCQYAYDVMRELREDIAESRLVVCYNRNFQLRELDRWGGFGPIKSVDAMRLADAIIRDFDASFGYVSLEHACNFFGINPPRGATPVERGLATVSAVRKVFEAAVMVLSVRIEERLCEN